MKGEFIYDNNVGRIRQDRCCFHCDCDHDRGSCVTSGGQIELPFQKITELGSDEVYVATTGRPKPPKTAVDQVYCIYYDDGEMTISQNEIEPEEGRTVVKKGFYSRPKSCTTEMITVRFVGAVKPKKCDFWFFQCKNLTEIKNIQNLYTDECTSMGDMFDECSKLASIDLSNFNTSNVTNMGNMFRECSKLTSLDLSNFDTSNVISMSGMFAGISMKSLNISNFDLSNITSLNGMFNEIKKLNVLILGELKFSDKTNVSNMFHTDLNTDGVHRIQKVYSSQKVKDKFCTKDSYGSSSTYWQQRGVESWIVQ